MNVLLTVGHGTADQHTLLDLFRGVDVSHVVDVRRYPGSRRNPDVSTEALNEWLPGAGIGYRWEARLGGRRQIPAAQKQDPDPWWQVEAFRAYAAHTRTAQFRIALSELLDGLAVAAPRTTLIMCSESLWWRCHRRLISDAAVLLHGTEVQHLAHDGRLTPHPPSPGARVTPEGLYYDRVT